MSEVADPRQTKWTTRRVFVLALVLTTLLGLFYSGATPVDDAYITFRYAANLVGGHGLAFNPGDRVEGYTSFGQILLIAPAALLGKNAPRLWSILLGLFAWAGVVALVWHRVNRERPAGRLDRPEWFAILYLALCTPGVVWAWSGMETATFALAWVAAWHLHLREFDADRLPWASALATFAAGLLHPEGVLIGLVLGASWLLPWSRRRLGRAATYLAIAWGLFGVYWLARWLYFGYPLPNTYYAKVGHGGALLWAGAVYVLRSALSALLPLIVLYLFARSRRAWRDWPRWFYVALGLVLVLVAYVVKVGGDYFAFQRFLLPTFPFLTLLAWRLWRDRRAAVPVRGRPWLWATVMALLLAAWSNMIPPGHMLQHKLLQRAVDDYVAAGRVLGRTLPKKAVVATIPIGAFGYYSGARILDLMGLTDVHLAHLDVRTGERVVGHEKYDYRYVMERRPDLIMQLPVLVTGDKEGVRAWLRQTTLNPQQYTIYKQKRLRGDYQLCWHPIMKRRAGRRAAPGEGELLGVYAYLRRDRLSDPAYKTWRKLPANLAALPFAEYRDAIAENIKLFGSHRMGMWKFTGAPAETADATPAADPVRLWPPAPKAP